MATTDTANDPAAPQRLVAVARGLVQGVGFRWYVQQHARALGLLGYAANERDGRTVTVVAEGGRDRLDQLVVRLRRGPRGSRVDAIEARYEAATGQFRDFGVW